MPVKVRANVVNITTDTPKANDVFLVDTNAWYWLFYPKASVFQLQNSAAQPYQVTDYPTYLKAVLSSGAKLYCSPLSFSELAHNIESAERSIYAFNANKTIGAKEFRHNYPNQRARVATLIQSVWQDVTDTSDLMPVNLDCQFTAAAVKKFSLMALDGYDLFMVEQALASGVTNIITDDSDYCSVPGITVFTSNQTAIREATSAKLLVVR
ncbi:PIN domain-containing protein [Pseudomonas sp. SCB32]|uniref:PIN domain-containing protein n=1 Tax=Pseudomonas sp. SCB32 TaxID=2653853 RepID=UPI00126555D3|nr:PIN domain-containing protein [Pseudomonas sp. SCB32]